MSEHGREGERPDEPLAVDASPTRRGRRHVRRWPEEESAMAPPMAVLAARIAMGNGAVVFLVSLGLLIGRLVWGRIWLMEMTGSKAGDFPVFFLCITGSGGLLLILVAWYFCFGWGILDFLGLTGIFLVFSAFGPLAAIFGGGTWLGYLLGFAAFVAAATPVVLVFLPPAGPWLLRRFRY